MINLTSPGIIMPTLLTIAMSVISVTSFSQNFTINDVIVSDTSFSICDAEYNSVLNMYCHATNSQGLYVGDIDPNTGDFLQPNGLGTLLDYSMISTVSTITRNGCEWGLSQQGHDIFYTDSTNQGFGFKLGRMRYSNGNWVYVPVDSSLNRTLLNALKDSSARYTGINYAKVYPDTSSALCSQYVDKNPFIETNYKDLNLKDCRWIKGWEAISTRKRVGLVTQGGIYDFVTNQFTQITTGVDGTDQPYCIRAPEFNNDFVFWCITHKPAGDVISAYRKTNGNWQFLYDLRPPTPHKIIESPESFEFNGKTYISLMLYPDVPNGQSVNLNSQVWIMSIDTTNGVMRLVSDTLEILNRQDPEYYIGNNEVYIYYAERREDNTPKGKHIIHRCKTGLSIKTGITSENVIPVQFELFQNSPNPFNPSTLIHYRLAASGRVSLQVYDVLGREIATLVNEFKQAGDHYSRFTANSNVSSALYFCHLKTKHESRVIKMMVVK